MIAAFCGNLRIAVPLILYAFTCCVESLTIAPANVLVVAGGEFSLRCQFGPSLAWTVHYLHGESCTLTSGSTYLQCADRERVSISYEGSSRSPTYILRIQRVRLTDAGSYVCSFGTESVQASLTVLGSMPSGDWNPKSVVAGDELSLTCRVAYHGSFAPRATWTNNTGASVSKGVQNLVAGSTNGTLMYMESTLTVPVAIGTVRVEPYTCTIGLSVPHLSTSLTWRSEAVIVSYCPRDLAIMSSDDVITVGTELTCVSDAHPAPVYRWLMLTGNGLVSESDHRTLTVTSQGNDGDYHFMCTAYNYLRGTAGSPCFASVEIQEYTVGVQENTGEAFDVSTSLTPKTATEATIPESGGGSPDDERRERTARSQHSTFDASYTSSETQQLQLSGYKTAIVVLSVCVCLIVFAVVIMGFVLARLARQLNRDRHAGAVYKTVEWRNSAKSVTTEMSSLTVGDTM